MKREKDLVDRIISELDAQRKVFKDFSLNNESIGQGWLNESNRIYNKIKANYKNLTEFRLNNLFVIDTPSRKRTFIRELVHSIQGLLGIDPEIHLMEDAYDFLNEQNLIDLLSSNQITNLGNPRYYSKNGLKFSYRWVRHIWLLSLFITHLSQKKTRINSIMDIGSSYGAFPYLIKRNFTETNFVLIDLPEQLAGAHYYLKSEFPDSKIATFSQIQELEEISNSFISEHDFVLVPCFYLNKLKNPKLDLVTNFASFNEMPRSWFNAYLESHAFKSARFFFSMNRIIRGGEGPDERNLTDKISMLEINFANYKQIHFDVNPFHKWIYSYKKFHGIPYKVKKTWYPPHYEFIGQLKTDLPHSN